jgi:hypothetical protein
MNRQLFTQMIWFFRYLKGEAWPIDKHIDSRLQKIKNRLMEKEIYEKAHYIKCRIQDINNNIDKIEMLRKKYKDDFELNILLQNYYGRLLNDISELESKFVSL